MSGPYRGPPLDPASVWCVTLKQPIRFHPGPGHPTVRAVAFIGRVHTPEDPDYGDRVGYTVTAIIAHPDDGWATGATSPRLVYVQVDNVLALTECP